ncbi:MAG: hypothetical protein ACOC3B_01155 [Bacillota bacterium]
MYRYSLLLLICFLLLSTTIILSNDLYGNTIEGLITDVDCKKNGIIIEGKTYTLIEGCTILRNDKYSELLALKPISEGFYHWAEININNSGFVTDIRAYYHLVEGIIEEVSYSNNYISLSLYKERNQLIEEIDTFYFDTKQREEIGSLEEGTHLVLILAKEKILKVVEY